MEGQHLNIHEIHDYDTESYIWNKAHKAASHQLQCEDESEIAHEMCMIGVQLNDERNRVVPIDVIAREHAWS